MTLPPEGQYITPHFEPEFWDKHINGMILKEWAGVFYGHTLEIGCNHGAMAYLISQISTVKSITAIDINKDAIALARNKYPHINFQPYDAREISVYCPQLFDFIVSFHTLEHIENPIKVVRNIWDCLRKGGAILISVPYKDAYGSDNYHVNSFDEDNFRDLFYGFQIIHNQRDERTDLNGEKHDVLTLYARKW